MPSTTLFGLGERETRDLNLKTDGTLYEMWAFDSPHEPNYLNGLYGNMPYVQGIGHETASGLAWLNSAHTWSWMVSAESSHADTDIFMVSETGALEVFLFSSAVKQKIGMLNRN